ncbi:ATP-binding cassette domain-containing protein [Fulvivirga lutimaris]|uniref:ATP-binding cassette domain-containing protein n=1 Tax=Fulvivirga lutimaris TaxID=1819566 RepID=UPI0012BD38FC|nr:ATP-binding cassette domain-containing protein [Fulvivirga lutimaris]MTI40969.1 ATP-binding cassette domain-containing protein [Fulvivirga lutimaris]
MTLFANTINHSFKNNRILDSAELTCNSGEITAIFGRNGSGKSTLMKILFGTQTPESIYLEINNVPTDPINVRRDKLIAFLPQQTFLPLNTRVRDIIPIYFDESDQQNEIFYAPRMASIERKLVKNLSMGERRYVELLLVSHLDHPIVILDEPFSMIEPMYKGIVASLLLELKSHKCIIITDHYYKDVLSVSDKNLILKDGKLISIKNSADLRRQGYLSSE